MRPRRTGRCQRCGRRLQDPLSVMRGIGPTCLGKLEAEG